MQLRLLSRYKAVVLLCLSLMLMLAGSVFAQEEDPLDLPADYESYKDNDKLNLNEMYSVANNHGEVRVIVGFDMNTFSGGNEFSRLPDLDQTAQIASAQNTLLSTLSAANVTAKHVKTYEYLPYAALTVDAAGLQALEKSPLVNYIQLDGMNFPTLAQSTVQIKAAGTGGAWAQGYDGQGVTVAVMDSGVLKTHPFLTGKVKAEACFGTNETFYDAYYGYIYVTSNCPGGATSSTANNSALPCSANGCDHGTHVAGIVAGNTPSLKGVAPQADLLAIQVFSRVSNTMLCAPSGGSPCILAFDSDMIGGLNWLYKQRKNYNIAAVNISIGGGKYTSQSTCNAQNKPMKAAIDKLQKANIAAVVASGNDGYTNALSTPACISSAVSVGSVTKSDSVSGFTNAAKFLDLLAPGSAINSSVLANGYESFDGTSMAAPHVAGAWAILRQHSPNAKVNKIQKAFAKTGVKITDSGSGNKFPRINVSEALAFLTKPDKPVLVSPSADFKTNATSTTFTWNQSANTASYKLVVKSPTNAKVVKQIISNASCSAGTCSYTHSSALTANGTYKWFVQARNEYNKKKSEKRNLIADYPGAPTLTTPANNSSTGTVNQFVWQSVSSATEYKIVVKDLTKGGKVINGKFAAASACSGATCSYTLTAEDQAKLKPNRQYQWFVQAISSAGKSKSDKYKFTTIPV